jgi:RHS repeat-associated protein
VSSDVSEGSSVSYLGKHFEVREHDAPTKYVWNGETRVARVSGSLSADSRIQRLRLWPGWNLCSLAVSVYLSTAEGEVVRSAFKWNPSAEDWLPVTSGQALPAGTVLWIIAASNATLTATGIYTEPTSASFTTNGGFLPGAGLEVMDLRPTLSNTPSATLWSYDALVMRWFAQLGLPLKSCSELGLSLGPGKALFAQAAIASRIEIPAPRLRLLYYHQDHLRSSVTVTDSEMQLLEERALYPYGRTRNVRAAVKASDPYLFTEKELDVESGLQYFGARFVSSVHGRFVAHDPYLTTSGAFARSRESAPSVLLTPQQNTPYAYAATRPTRFVDPDGRRIVLAEGSSPEFRAAFHEAIHYLAFKGDAATKELIKSMMSDKTPTIVISETTVIKGDSDYYYHEARAIDWNPKMAVRDTLTGATVSPASLLLHEMAHAQKSLKNRSEYLADLLEKKDYAGTPEEENRSLRVERKAAAALGEGQRQGHTGRAYPVTGPTQRDPVEGPMMDRGAGPVFYPLQANEK